MPSAESWKVMENQVKIGHFFKAYSFIYVRHGNLIEAVRSESVKTVTIVTFLMLLINICTFLLFGIGGYFYSEHIIVSMLCLGPMILFFFDIGCQFWYCSSHDQIYFLIVKYVEFSNRLGVSNNGKKDGYERVIETVALTYNFANSAVIPGVLCFGYFGDNMFTRTAVATVHGVLQLLCTPFGIILPEFVLALALPVMTLLGCLAAINGNFCSHLFVNCALFYTLFTKESIGTLRSKLGASEEKNFMPRLQLEYASHQVLNKIANDVFKWVVEFALYAGCVVLIISSYALLTVTKNASYASLSIIFCSCSISAFVSIKYSLELAISCHICSDSFRKHCKTVDKSKYGKCFWNGRQPLTIHVGDHFRLETMQYILVVFGNIVLENLISLLIAF